MKSVLALVALYEACASAQAITGTGGSISQTTGHWNSTKTQSSRTESSSSSSSSSLSTTLSSFTSSVVASSGISSILPINGTTTNPPGTGQLTTNPLPTSQIVTVPDNTTIPLAGTGGTSSSPSSISTSSSQIVTVQNNSTGLLPTGGTTSSQQGSTDVSSITTSSTSSGFVSSGNTSLPFGTGSLSSSTPAIVPVANVTLLPGQAITTDGTTYFFTSNSEYINGSPTSAPTTVTPPGSETMTDPGVTSTMTTVPSGVEIEYLTDASITTNQWVTTTASDGSETVVPIIIPCIGCAPILIELPPIPGVEFDWPKFPKLPKFHLPCIKFLGITIGQCDSPPVIDGPAPDPETPTSPSPESPTPSSTTSTSSSSSSSCTSTETASDCRVMCRPTVTSTLGLNTTTQSCSTSCYKTITGCSVTGDTTTTTYTSSNSTSTAATSAVPACPLATDDGPALKARAMQPGGNAFHRRAGALVQPASTVVAAGACNLAAMTPAATPVTRPAYPKGESMISADRNGQLVGASDVLRYVTMTSCPLAIKTNDLAAQDAQRWPTSTDHTYEIHWLDDFFTWLTGGIAANTAPISCATFQSFFFDQDSTGNSNRLTAVWNALPSADWMQGFAMMTNFMNTEAKGTVANIDKLRGDVGNRLGETIQPKTQAAQALKFLKAKVDTIQKVNIGCLTMNYSPVMDTIAATWKRIYQALKDADQAVQCDLKSPTTVSLAQSFVDYSNYMFNDGTNGIDPVSRSLADQLLKQIPTTISQIKAKYTKLNAAQQGDLANYEAIYNMVMQSGDPTDSSNRAWGVAFDPDALASSVEKRYISKRQACSLQPSAGGSGTPTAGASITVTGPNGVVSTLPANATVTAGGSSNSTITSIPSTTAAATNNITTTTPFTTTTAPPITSCALTSAPATTFSGITLSADTYCACNDGWQAGLGSTIGSDQSTTYTCEVGTSTTIAVSTAPPTTTEQPTTTTSEVPTSTTPTPTPTASCHTQYKLVLDSFDIYGANWDESLLDAGGDPGSGNGLLEQIRGCSAVTKWGFDQLTPTDDSPWTFHAHGQTTIWQKKCIEHAMVSGGAPEGSGCDGSG